MGAAINQCLIAAAESVLDATLALKRGRIIYIARLWGTQYVGKTFPELAVVMHWCMLHDHADVTVDASLEAQLPELVWPMRRLPPFSLPVLSIDV